jgi:colicin import membrane protein
VGKPITPLSHTTMSSPIKSHAAASDAPVPALFEESSSGSEGEDAEQIEREAEAARQRIEREAQARRDAAKAKSDKREARRKEKAAQEKARADALARKKAEEAAKKKAEEAKAAEAIKEAAKKAAGEAAVEAVAGPVRARSMTHERIREVSSGLCLRDAGAD